uniref:Acyl-CoA-binding domain-containing protein 6 n=1 Tax=Panagrolaimus sp. PS1159 TaxID=55785 RepID=A0AC35GIF2_9BILA
MDFNEKGNGVLHSVTETRIEVRVKSLNKFKKAKFNLTDILKLFDNYEKNELKSKPSKIPHFSTLYDETKMYGFSSSKANNITLNLHVSAYGNSTADVSDIFNWKNNESLEKKKCGSFKKQENTKQTFATSTFVLQNPFEFPRHHYDKLIDTEVSQYRPSQRLFNPNRNMGNKMPASLEQIFKSATGFFGQNYAKVDQPDQLTLYGLFKQATEGDNPQNFILSYFNYNPKSRAWISNRGMSIDEAKMKYIEVLELMDVGWSVKTHQEHGSVDGGMGLAPSTLRGEITEPTTSFEIFYDNVRKGNIEEVCSVCENDPYLAGTRDDTNGTAMHWAADSNQHELLEYLPLYGFRVYHVDNEGQTPLHIAAICDYPLTVLKLLDMGSDPYIKDNEGITPMDLMISSPNLINLPRIAGLSSFELQ